MCWPILPPLVELALHAGGAPQRGSLVGLAIRGMLFSGTTVTAVAHLLNLRANCSRSLYNRIRINCHLYKKLDLLYIENAKFNATLTRSAKITRIFFQTIYLLVMADYFYKNQS